MMRQYDLIERVRRYNPDTNEALLNRAYVYAMKAHGEQRRASGDPYFSHPIEVAAILTDLKLDDATIAAALLHDTIEDTEATRAEIDSLFGHDIGTLVEGLTKLKKLDLVTKEAKQAENLRKLLLAIADDVRVLLIKLADRLHNMRTLGYMPPEARRRAAEETLEIYAPLAGRMGMHEMREELDDLAFRELYPEAYEVVTARLNALTERSKLLISEIEKQLTKKLADRGIDARVVGRRKRAYSIWRKMERKSVGFEQLSDIFGFRVVVKTLADCYQALGIVHSTWPMVPGRFKDYISTPKGNDYRSIHTTVIGPSKQRVELQIRTVEMHEIAEYGIAAHALYKDNAGSPTELLSRESTAYAWLRRTIELLAEGSNPEEFLEHTKLELFHDQVFCFSPKGKLIALPRKATPIDFAYAVHTDVGNTAVGCKINGQIAPLTSELVNGDEVEIADLESAKGAAGRLGIDCRDRQGARGDPAGNACRRAHAICGSRPPHCRASVPAREDRLFGRKSDRRAAASGACVDRGCDGCGRTKRIEGVRRRARHVPRLQGRARCRHGRQSKTGQRLVRLEETDVGQVQGAGQRARAGNSDPRHQWRSAGAVSRRMAARCRAIASSAFFRRARASRSTRSNRRRLSEFEDKPERWLDVRWDEEERAPRRFPARIAVQSVNEPGSLAQIAQVIAEHDGNIDNIRMTRRAPDFTDVTIDLEVYDLKHLTAILAQLRAKPVVAKAERVNG